MQDLVVNHKKGFLKYCADLKDRIVYLDSSVVNLPSFALTSIARYASLKNCPNVESGENFSYERKSDPFHVNKIVNRSLVDTMGQLNVLSSLKERGLVYVDNVQSIRFTNGNSRVSKLISQYLQAFDLWKQNRDLLCEIREQMDTFLQDLPQIRSYSLCLQDGGKLFDIARKNAPNILFGLAELDQKRVEFYLNCVAQSLYLLSSQTSMPTTGSNLPLFERKPIIFSLEKTLQSISENHFEMFPEIKNFPKVNVLSPDYCSRGVPYKYSLKS